jgi:hypothetical protein
MSVKHPQVHTAGGEMGTPFTSIFWLGSGKGYTLHIHATGRGKGCTLHVHTAFSAKGYNDTTCMSILLPMERDNSEGPYWRWKGIQPQCLYCWWWIGIHPACPYCWQWTGYTLHVHRRLLTVLLLPSYVNVGMPDES